MVCVSFFLSFCPGRRHQRGADSRPQRRRQPRAARLSPSPRAQLPVRSLALDQVRRRCPDSEPRQGWPRTLARKVSSVSFRHDCAALVGSDSACVGNRDRPKMVHLTEMVAPGGRLDGRFQRCLQRQSLFEVLIRDDGGYSSYGHFRGWSSHNQEDDLDMRLLALMLRLPPGAGQGLLYPHPAPICLDLARFVRSSRCRVLRWVVLTGCGSRSRPA